MKIQLIYHLDGFPLICCYSPVTRHQSKNYLGGRLTAKKFLGLKLHLTVNHSGSETKENNIITHLNKKFAVTGHNSESHFKN